MFIFEATKFVYRFMKKITGSFCNGFCKANDLQIFPQMLEYSYAMILNLAKNVITFLAQKSAACFSCHHKLSLLSGTRVDNALTNDGCSFKIFHKVAIYKNGETTTFTHTIGIICVYNIKEGGCSTRQLL